MILKSLPNLLSAARLLLTPYVCYLLWTRQFDATFFWFIVAAVTDGLDGWLARRLHVESRFGAMLDPIADKVLLSGAFITLVVMGAIPTLLAVMVLGRDALILLAAGVLLAAGRGKGSFPPSLLGKLSTIAQMSYVPAVVLEKTGAVSQDLVTIIAWVVGLLAVASGIDYALKLRKYWSSKSL